ncbi:hypothetical protein Q31a_19140 [Aureliella helgolandensis]|uniref:Uncharacterized protein n=1 Tax=Aureliella helgolandensis TaxID=2527968 RepID=A0A518G4T6_9BACT|nr:hypothetical protein Q31a_19140 [Aureliella helgolandensis]
MAISVEGLTFRKPENSQLSCPQGVPCVVKTAGGASTHSTLIRFLDNRGRHRSRACKHFSSGPSEKNDWWQLFARQGRYRGYFCCVPSEIIGKCYRTEIFPDASRT